MVYTAKKSFLFYNQILVLMSAGMESFRKVKSRATSSIGIPCYNFKQLHGLLDILVNLASKYFLMGMITKL